MFVSDAYFKSHYFSYYNECWQNPLTTQIHSCVWYRVLKLMSRISPLSSQFSRRDQVVYNHLRIGHSCPTQLQLQLFYTNILNHCVYFVTLHFQLSIFSPNVLTFGPFELIIVLLQIYLNFFIKYIPLLYYIL